MKSTIAAWSSRRILIAVSTPVWVLGPIGIAIASVVYEPLDQLAGMSVLVIAFSMVALSVAAAVAGPFIFKERRWTAAMLGLLSICQSGFAVTLQMSAFAVARGL